MCHLGVWIIMPSSQWRVSRINKKKGLTSPLNTYKNLNRGSVQERKLLHEITFTGMTYLSAGRASARQRPPPPPGNCAPALCSPWPHRVPQLRTAQEPQGPDYIWVAFFCLILRLNWMIWSSNLGYFKFNEWFMSQGTFHLLNRKALLGCIFFEVSINVHSN